jgi:hypothetical protein
MWSSFAHSSRPNGHLHDIGGELMLTDPPDAFHTVLMSVNMIRIGLWQLAHQSPRGYLTLVEWLKITRDHCTLAVLSDSIVKEVQVDCLNGPGLDAHHVNLVKEVVKIVADNSPP